jgi:regulation of enolase protein 1 (concanavalin A-like superfamily)
MDTHNHFHALLRATLLLFLMLYFACTQDQESNSIDTKELKGDNLLKSMSKDNLNGFNWMNQPESYSLDKGMLSISPKDNSDYFNDPGSDKIVNTAPFLYREMSENFVATALVKPDFKDIWNACALMVYIDSLHWGKLCFENSDATGPSIVTVVTKGRSDDSNGPLVNESSQIWLRIVRKDNLFGFYWSKNGKNFRMARLFSLPSSSTVKIGMEAQCPVGESVTHKFLFFSMEETTIEDMRKGI